MMLRDAVRKVGHGAKDRAGAVRHSVHDRSQERRLERTAEEAMRLRSENEVLRNEVAETRAEHHMILDLLESRLAAPEVEVEEGGRKRSHRGRWILFLAAIGGGAFALMRRRSNGHQEWADMEDRALSGTGASAT